MNLRAHRDAVVAHLQDKLGNAVSVGAFPGRFTEESLRQFMLRAPAVCVGAVAVDEIEPQDMGHLVAKIRFTAGLATKDRPNEKVAQDGGGTEIVSNRRDELALDLLEQTILALSRSQPGTHAPHHLAIGVPRRFKATNLFSGSLQTTGVSVWWLEWVADVEIGEPDPLDLPWLPGSFEELQNVTGRGRIRSGGYEEHEL